MTDKNIPRDTIKRILRDVSNIIKNPLAENDIYYVHNEDDIMKGNAMIIGPKDTPYFGGYYFFNVEYPSDYPYSPPVFTFMTKNKNTRFNPNLYRNGKVCLSILNTWAGEQWSSCQTLTSILLTLCTILNESPLLNEPGMLKTDADFKPYQEAIIYNNINFAVCNYLIQLDDNVESCKIFNHIIISSFLSKYQEILNIVEEKCKEFPVEIINFVSIYSMKTCINYNYLKNKLIDIKKQVDNNYTEKEEEK